MAQALGLRITAIHTARTGAVTPAEEYLVLFNEGSEGQGLAGWTLTLQAGQRARAIYTFPARLTVPGRGEAHWQLEPGARLYVWTGPGRDSYAPPPPVRTAPHRAPTGRYRVHLGREAFVWAPPGAQVALRRPDGRAAGRPFLAP